MTSFETISATNSPVLRPTEPIILPLAATKAQRRWPTITQSIAGIDAGRNGHERYSIAKLLAFEKFMASASLSRVLTILFVSSLPGLLVTLIPTLIPLQDPFLGISANPGFFGQLTAIIFLVATGVVMYVQADANILRHYYSNRETLAVSVLYTCIHVGIVDAMTIAWRFPIPFLWGSIPQSPSQISAPRTPSCFVGGSLAQRVSSQP